MFCSLPAIYQITPDIIISIRILRKADPEITHIPVKKSAAIAKTAFFAVFADEKENLTEKISKTAKSNYMKNHSAVCRKTQGYLQKTSQILKK